MFRDWTQAWCYNVWIRIWSWTSIRDSRWAGRRIKKKKRLTSVKDRRRSHYCGWCRSSRFKMSLGSCDQHWEPVQRYTGRRSLGQWGVTSGPASVVAFDCLSWLAFQCGSHWVWAFMSSLVSESLFKKPESIFVHFKLCNAHHLFLLTEKKM